MKKHPKRLALTKETLRMISGSAYVMGEGSSIQPPEPDEPIRTVVAVTKSTATHQGIR